jgi:hypothetical protein
MKSFLAKEKGVVLLDSLRSLFMLHFKKKGRFCDKNNIYLNSYNQDWLSLFGDQKKKVPLKSSATLSECCY